MKQPSRPDACRYLGRRPPAGRRCILFGVCLLVGLLWSYWPALCSVENRWCDEPAVLFRLFCAGFALLVLWFRRKGMPTTPRASLVGRGRIDRGGLAAL